MFCNVCHAELGDALYEAKSNQALTSLCELRLGKVRVWLCHSCGHLCGEPMPDTQQYYESDYRILLDHEDEDQIYEVQGNHITYRTDHQVATLLKKLNLPSGARLLDYGCAKASTPRRLLAIRPDIEVKLFDVSAMYTSHWEKFLPDNSWAVHNTPNNWLGHFDIVTSFFALEHIPNPVDTVRKVADLMSEDGVFYGIVPDTFGNVADFVVIDHVNHFTQCSLHTLLLAAGFTDIDIDANAHRGALVFSARKTGPASAPPDLASCLTASQKLASYWTAVNESIYTAEVENDGMQASIYGSGFYGAYIASQLQKPECLNCFLDASPFQQGKTLFGRPVLPPSQLPDSVRVLYIGLNPMIARRVVANMDWLHDRELQLVFMDDFAP